MKRLVGLSALAVIISGTSGCSWLMGEHGYFRDRGNDYLDARQTAPMEVPTDVQNSKRLDPLLPIPRNVADSQADKQRFEVPRPQPLQVAAETSDFTLQRSAGSSWILAQHPPAEAWPLAHQFFEDNGFRIVDDKATTGEFSTAWQPLGELSGALADHLRATAPGSDIEARVHVRIEPGVARNSSEIYLTSAQRPAGSSADVAFPTRPTGNGMDATLVDQMLASLTRGAEKGGSISMLAARDYDAPSRVSLSEDGSGNPVLTVGTDLDRAWTSVGRALDHGQWRVEDVNRSLGLYYINLAEKPGNPEDNKPGFFGRMFGHTPTKEELEARAERYQVRLSKVGDGVEVTVEKNINTVAPADVSRRVLNVIQDNLG
ncbi:outer membrane protein assembly factor BamC [Pseudomonas sp. NPDC007930]|uniref:outer membrane protein assembly factor BamC n=1 Tax=Pseudomonas sp. NPDC007930 TaxID=3364417 RepID=UPI0036E16002